MLVSGKYTKLRFWELWSRWLKLLSVLLQEFEYVREHQLPILTACSAWTLNVKLDFFLIITGVIMSLTSFSHETVILAIYDLINIDDLKSQLPLFHLVVL